jgi:hypothetical protein
VYNDAASTAEVTQSLILYVFIDTQLTKCLFKIAVVRLWRCVTERQNGQFVIRRGDLEGLAVCREGYPTLLADREPQHHVAGLPIASALCSLADRF